MKDGFFNALNYTLGNEDTTLEWELLPKKTRHVIAAAGSGSRIIPLLAKSPQQLTCVDLSIEQLALVELRLATVKYLTHQKFLAFWGYTKGTMCNKERRDIFENLALSPDAKNITSNIFNTNNWNPILYVGKWEKTFKKLSKIVRGLVGKKGLDVFSCKTLEEQKIYFSSKFPKRNWSLAVYLLGNAAVFNTLLYRGDFPKKNIGGTYQKFYLERFDNLFKQGLVSHNYFLQLLFFGEIKFLEGAPLEADIDIFLSAKNALDKTNISYKHQNIIEVTKNTPEPTTFLSMSDIPSYLKPPQEQNFLQEIYDSISPGGIIVNRYYMRIPEKLNENGYLDITNDYKNLINREKIQMYSFGIYRKL